MYIFKRKKFWWVQKNVHNVIMTFTGSLEERNKHKIPDSFIAFTRYSFALGWALDPTRFVNGTRLFLYLDSFTFFLWAEPIFRFTIFLAIIQFELGTVFVFVTNSRYV